MAKRDRTTGLPRPRRRDRHHERAPRFYERDWVVRGLLVGLPLVFIVAIAGLLGWRWYDDNFRRPDQVILQVEDQKVTLGYLSDRLEGFARQNPGSAATIAQALFRKIEDEELIILMAKQQGITLTDDDVTNHIAEQLDVEPDTTRGSEFDRAYRNLLQTSGLSNDDYRRVAEAELAQQRLSELRAGELPTTGDTISYRFFAANDAATAQEAIDRIRAGEDFDTVADEISPIAPDDGSLTGDDTTDDLGVDATADEDGNDDPRLIESQLIQQIPSEVRSQIETAQAGDLLMPIPLGGAYVIIQVVDRNPETELTEDQLNFLAGEDFQEQLDAFRGTVNIERNFGTDDIEWARQNA